MARRFSCKVAACTTTDTNFAHGLGAAPDEWAVNLRGPAHGAASVYVNGAPDATNIVIAANAAGSCSVFAWINHSLIQ